MALETMLLPIQIPVRTNGIGRIVLQFLIIASRFHPTKCQDESGAREYETGGKGWGNYPLPTISEGIRPNAGENEEQIGGKFIAMCSEMPVIS
jgi:hypothetical protein